MSLMESGIEVDAFAESTSGILSFDITNLTQDFFYLIVSCFDTMYNQSHYDLVSTSTLAIHNPIHRWYEKQYEYAGYDAHHFMMLSQEPVEVGLIEDIYKDNIESGNNTLQAVYFKFNVKDLKESPSSSFTSKNNQKRVDLMMSSSFISVEKAAKNLLMETILPSLQNGGHDLKGDVEAHEHEDIDDIRNRNLQALKSLVSSSSSSASASVSYISEIEKRIVLNDHSRRDKVFVDVLQCARDMQERVTHAWNQRLGSIHVGYAEGDDTIQESEHMKDQLVIFYTAMWHTMLSPRVTQDNDNEYLRFDGGKMVMSTHGDFVYLDDMSIWDIYRAVIPLYNLIHTDVSLDIVKSLVAKSLQGNWLPIFPGNVIMLMKLL